MQQSSCTVGYCEAMLPSAWGLLFHVVQDPSPVQSPSGRTPVIAAGSFLLTAGKCLMMIRAQMPSGYKWKLE